ncbi:hypothetical protein ACLK17_00345 [Escherichia coli]
MSWLTRFASTAQTAWCCSQDPSRQIMRAKLGYRLKAAVSNHASTVSVQDGKATVKHMVYGGLAIGEERIATPYAVLTISSGTFDAAQPDASRTGETHTVEWQAPAVAITRTATQAP